MLRVMCGTPKGHCSGSPTALNFGLGKERQNKTHTSHEQAFRCYKNWLISFESHVEISNRELRQPGGGILVLTKQSRFGAALRPGKSETGSRFQPRGRAAAGVIIKQ